MKTYNLFLALFFYCAAFSQDQWLNFTNNHYVTDLVEVEGGLWVASSGGICYFDTEKNEATYYNRGNSGIPSNQVHDLLYHPQGELWMTTSLGVCYFKDGQFYPGPANLTGQLRVNNDGKVVVANGDQLYIQREDTVFDALPYPTYLADLGGIEINQEGDLYVNGINFFQETFVAVWKDNQWEFIFSDFIYESSIAMDTQDRLWFLSTLGLQYYKDGNWTHVTDIDSLNAFSLGHLSIDSEDNVLIATGDECPSLFKWDGTKLVEVSFIKDECTDCHFVGTSVTTPNYYYGSNRYHGLYGFNDEEVFAYRPLTQSPLYQNSVLSILHPSDGGHLVITPQKIQKFQNGIWTEIPLPNDLSRYIASAGLSMDQTLWINDGEVLWSYDNTRWTKVLPPPIFIDKIKMMTVGDNGDVWVQSGLNISRYRTGQWRTFNAGHHHITSSIVKDMVVDPSNGDLWVSTFQGVRHYDGQAWYIYDIPPINHTFDLAIGEEGVFVNTGSLYLITEGRIENVPMPQEGYYGTFDSRLAYDLQNGRLYLSGTHVLAVYEDGVWTVYDTQNSGVYNGYTSDIGFDEKRNVWLAGDQGGVGVFNESGVVLTRIDDHQADDFSIDIFPSLVLDGQIYIQSPESGLHHVAVSDALGRILLNQEIHLIEHQAQKILWPGGHGIFFFAIEKGRKSLSKKVIVRE